MPEQIELAHGLVAWLEGKDDDIAINDRSAHMLIVLSQEDFDRLDAFRLTGRNA